VALLAVLLCACVALAACAGSSAQPAQTASSSEPGALAVGSSTQTIAVGGATRTFHLYRPADVANPAPLVVMLHGGFGSGTQAEGSYGWDAKAAAAHFVVAYPDGLDHAWNTEGGCCGKPAQNNADDVAFISQMIAAIEREMAIDPARVYATGISNGGIMAYTLACDTTLFAAIGPDSATQLAPCPSPRPLSVIHIHGTADTKIPYDGGSGDGTEAIDGPSIPAVNAMWRQIDDCADPTVDTAATVTTSTAQCPDGNVVELVTIDGAGHQWPGGAPKKGIQKLLGSDPPSTALNATDAIWQFFSQHPAAA
jgi:polyhydroxybutyrate depolymerase